MEKKKRMKSYLFEKINKIDKPLVRIRNKMTLLSEMKEEASLQSQTLKGYKRNSINNFMTTNLIA
jgi:DNA polymerase III delta prime subunit